ncbi:MAG: hypothetical protein WBW48_10030 [Anaerolineae bacterium]
MAKKVARVSLIVLSLWMVVSATTPAAVQPPPIPHSFYGAVEINGEPAPVGTQVEARGTGVLTGMLGNPITVTQVGQYGGPGGFDPKLAVQGQVADGTPIEFYVDGVRAQCAVPGGPWQESYPFSSGAVTELNLRACTLPGDIDCDCDVDIVDVMLVANCWRSTDPECDPYDLDDDGDIDIVDIMLVVVHWGDAC